MDECSRSKWTARSCHAAVVVLLVLFTLPSCLTAYLWHAHQPQLRESVEVGTAHAVVDASGVRFVVAGDLLAGARLPTEGDAWLEVRPLEREREIVELLADAAGRTIGGEGAGGRIGITFDAATSPPQPGAPVVGTLRLSAMSASAVGDAGENAGERVLTVSCRGTWVAAPPAGVAKLDAGVRELSYEGGGTPAWGKAVLTPVTLAVDLVVTPVLFVFGLAFYAAD